LLNIVDYIAIDCGYERGKEQTHTFVETNAFLVDRGFRAVQANFHRMTILYRNMVKEAKGSALLTRQPAIAE
jgi:hypothetical protein